jgi:peroxin-19
MFGTTLLIYLDMLDEFSPAKLDSKKEAPEASGPGRPTLQSSAALHDTTDDFTKQLQQEMAALVGEIEGSPEMRQNMEAMLRELNPVMGIKGDDNATPNMEREVHSTGASSAVPAQEEGFQETIRKTIERMQASGDQATAAAASNEDDILAQMLKEMQSGGLNDGGSENDFSKMLMGMMEQLTNKDILYEPMKELHDKFPAWMSKNRSSTAPDDLQRYEDQQRLVGDIVARFERKSYSDENVADREFIVERMQKVL